MNERVKASNELYRLTHNNDYELYAQPNPEASPDCNVLWHIMDAIGCFNSYDRVYGKWWIRRLADFIDQTCYLEYDEWIPSGGDECDLEWNWRCSNCDFDLADNYEDLDIKTPKELGLFHCPHCGARILGTRYRKDDNSER